MTTGGAADMAVDDGDTRLLPINAMCVTPFTSDDRIDVEALERIVSSLADAGVAAYLGSYGTGEGHLLRHGEHVDLYETGVRAAAGRVPIYAAALGFTDTDTVVAQAMEANSIGVDAVQIHPPRPSRPGKPPRTAEIERYYSDVLSAIRTPIHLTNQTLMVGYAIPPTMVADLVETYPHVVAVNDTNGDLGAVLAMIEHVGRRVAVRVGLISQLATVLLVGAQGALCFEANVSPSLCREVVQRFGASDLVGFASAYRRLMQLNDVLRRFETPRATKAAMELVGLPSGSLRRPYLPLAKSEIEELRVVLANLGVLDV